MTNFPQPNLCIKCGKPAKLKEGLCWDCRRAVERTSNSPFSARGYVGQARRRKAKKVSKDESKRMD